MPSPSRSGVRIAGLALFGLVVVLAPITASAASDAGASRPGVAPTSSVPQPAEADRRSGGSAGVAPAIASGLRGDSVDRPVAMSRRGAVEPADTAWPYDNERGWSGWPNRTSSPRLAWAVAPAVASETSAPAIQAPSGAPSPRTSASKAKPNPPVASSAAPKPRYAGRNHLWIPALGIDRSISLFSCDSSADPGDRVYRWGCAGAGNVYLFGHAHSVFKPLHDAYVAGRLRKGVRVIYADADGRVRTYTVRYWKVVSPVGSEWAYAAQSTASLTLQTCVGAESEMRLVVRLALAS